MAYLHFYLWLYSLRQHNTNEKLADVNNIKVIEVGLSYALNLFDIEHIILL